MLKIRRPLGRLIFNMGIAIPGKTVFLIETAPSTCTTDPIYGNHSSDKLQWSDYIIGYQLVVSAKAVSGLFYSSNPWLAKRPLETNGHLANRGLTS